METSSSISDDKYVSMTDEAEAARYDDLTGNKGVDDDSNGFPDTGFYDADEFSPPTRGAFS
jgi:hypothetical protein